MASSDSLINLSVGDEPPGFSVLVAAFDCLALVVGFFALGESDDDLDKFAAG